jgi:transcriptional regulator with PAS, ATPase and Fis domain
MAYGRVVFVLGAQTSLDPIIQFCEGVKKGRVQFQDGAVPPVKGRLSDAEVLGVLNQVFQLDLFLKKEEIRSSFCCLGMRPRQDMQQLAKVFGSEIEDSEILSSDDLYQIECDALVYIPLDTTQPKQVEHLARLSMVAPRVRHVAFTASPKWNHSQLMALKETWEWMDPRQSARLQSFAEEIIRVNGGLTRKDIARIEMPQAKEASIDPTIITRSPLLKELLALVDAVADTDSTILITGESGTGKELIANRIHARSHRAQAPHVAVNCGAIPSELLESELFGHMKGAFTGAVNNREGRFDASEGGTLFLDEIGEMGANLQVKLLRVLQTKRYEPVGSTKSKNADVRIVAATNRNLENEVRDGRFREDLFYRLNVIPVHVPALRERREDVPLLVDFFIKKFNREKTRRVTGVTRAAVRALVACEWPGNVRELENLMERMVILKSSGMIDVLDFPERYRRVSLSEIEYEDLINPKKSFVSPAQSEIGAGMGNYEMQSYEIQSMENEGEESMKSNQYFGKGNIQQSANGSTDAGQGTQEHNGIEGTEGAITEGNLTIEAAIRMLSDRLIFPNEGLDFNSVVDQFENILILQALERTGWNRNRAAGLLRLNRTTLVEKLKKKQLVPPMRFDDRALSGNA